MMRTQGKADRISNGWIRVAGSAALAAGLALAASPSLAAPAGAPDRVKAFAALPDWSGVWLGTGSQFDQSRGARNLNSDYEARDYPPYNPKWEAQYQSFLDRVVRPGKYVDPLTLCYPAGFPRLASAIFGIQFVPTPEQTLIIFERNGVRHVWTDGRGHPTGGDLWPSWEGHSIGHWEGDTLVIETVAMKAGVPLDRTGLVLSADAKVDERIRMVSPGVLEDQLVISDPVALTQPWHVTRRYTRQKEKFAEIGTVACAESQRNPVVKGENTVTLGAEIGHKQNLYPDEIMSLATPMTP